MSLKKYQNEFIALVALLMLIIAFFYKSAKVHSGAQEALTMEQSIGEFKEIVNLKKIWANKNISKKIDILKQLLPENKVKWNKKGKKLTATYENLSASELNKLVIKILSMAVQINLLKIDKKDSSYKVEFKCKW